MDKVTKILCLGAYLPGCPLNIKGEFAAIENIVKSKFEFSSEESVNADRLLSITNTIRPNILHLFFNLSSKNEYVTLANDGKWEEVSYDFLVFALAGCGISLIVLNFSFGNELARRLVETSGISVVIATTTYVQNSIIEWFAEEFYKKLSSGETLSEAYNHAVRECGVEKAFRLRHSICDNPNEIIFPKLVRSK